MYRPPGRTPANPWSASVHLGRALPGLLASLALLAVACFALATSASAASQDFGLFKAVIEVRKHYLPRVDEESLLWMGDHGGSATEALEARHLGLEAYYTVRIKVSPGEDGSAIDAAECILGGTSYGLSKDQSADTWQTTLPETYFYLENLKQVLVPGQGATFSVTVEGQSYIGVLMVEDYADSDFPLSTSPSKVSDYVVRFIPDAGKVKSYSLASYTYDGAYQSVSSRTVTNLTSLMEVEFSGSYSASERIYFYSILGADTSPEGMELRTYDYGVLENTAETGIGADFDAGATDDALEQTNATAGAADTGNATSETAPETAAPEGNATGDVPAEDEDAQAEDEAEAGEAETEAEAEDEAAAQAEEQGPAAEASDQANATQELDAEPGEVGQGNATEPDYGIGSDGIYADEDDAPEYGAMDQTDGQAAAEEQEPATDEYADEALGDALVAEPAGDKDAPGRQDGEGPDAVVGAGDAEDGGAAAETGQAGSPAADGADPSAAEQSAQETASTMQERLLSRLYTQLGTKAVLTEDYAAGLPAQLRNLDLQGLNQALYDEYHMTRFFEALVTPFAFRVVLEPKDAGALVAYAREVSGLGGERRVSSLKLVKLLGSEYKVFSYADTDDAARAEEGTWCLLDARGEYLGPEAALNEGQGPFYAVVFVRDGGDFDLDLDTPGVVVDPVVLGKNISADGWGGCVYAPGAEAGQEWWLLLAGVLLAVARKTWFRRGAGAHGGSTC